MMELGVIHGRIPVYYSKYVRGKAHALCMTSLDVTCRNNLVLTK
jgi:hypothetical protein